MDELSALAVKYGTDKGPQNNWHNYTEHYHRLCELVRYDVRSVLEIGVQFGQSLRMWRDYFPHAVVEGLDITDCRKDCAGEERIVVHVGDAADGPTVRRLIAPGYFDLVVDDGSHQLDDIVAAFRVLYPATRLLYIIEDIGMFCTEAQLRIALENVEPSAVVPSQNNEQWCAWVFDKRVPC